MIALLLTLSFCFNPAPEVVEAAIAAVVTLIIVTKKKKKAA